MIQCLPLLALLNSHHCLRSLLATIKPINSPAEPRLIIGQEEMTPGVTEGKQTRLRVASR